MLKKYTKGKVAVFIDAANILYSQQTLGWRIDYQKLRDYLQIDGGKLLPKGVSSFNPWTYFKRTSRAC